MQWAHREILVQIKGQAQLYGISIYDSTEARYTSKFYAKTNAPCIRCKALKKEDFEEEKLVEWLKKRISDDYTEEEMGSLKVGGVIPIEGGELLATLDNGKLKIVHADINASWNLQRRFWGRHTDLLNFKTHLSGRKLYVKDDAEHKRFDGALKKAGFNHKNVGLTRDHGVYKITNGKNNAADWSSDDGKYSPNLFRDVSGEFYKNEDKFYPKSDFEETVREGAEISHTTLYSKCGRLCGKIDSLKSENDEYIPIVLPKINVWSNDLAQIAGQMYLLSSNGYTCRCGKIYYRASNRLVDVEYTVALYNLTEKLIGRVSEIRKCKKIPEPLVDSDKCVRCSLNFICLPDEQNFIVKKIGEPRRLYPGRPDGGILYVISNGGKVSKEGDNFSIWTPDSGKSTIPVKDVEHICLFGYVQITTQAVREMLKHEGTISYFSSSGYLEGITTGIVTKNITLRQKQFTLFAEFQTQLALAKSIVKAKIENQRTLLRRNGSGLDEPLKFMKSISKQIDMAENLDSLRGFEGIAAQKYWVNFSTMLGTDCEFDIVGRNKRPPKDEINAMLSYGYSLLTRDFSAALASVGFDYMLGFYHAVVAGKPAFSLDMMESYRPLIVDSVVLRLVNEKQIAKEDFAVFKGGVYMKDTVKKKLISAYERRVDNSSEIWIQAILQKDVHVGSKTTRQIFN